MHAFAEQMEEARRRNINANELAMKAIAFDADKLADRIGLEIKADGIGLLDVNGIVQTLEGVDFAAARHLEGELSALRAAFGCPMVLHGEYIEHGGFEATLSAFRSGQGAGGAVLWDAVPLKVWHGLEHSLPLHERRELLEAAFDTVRPRMVRLNPMLNSVQTDKWTVTLLDAALHEALDDGHEGLVVKDLDSPYVRAKSPYWMKLKTSETVDVPVQATRVGADGRLQSIVVTVDGKPAVVGAGFSEMLRLAPDEFAAGRLVEIRHIGRTANGALKGAAFVRFRDDKMGEAA